MIPRTAPIAGVLLALVLAASAAPTLAADPNEFSRAENLVFVDRHLGNLKPPAALRYEYVKSGALEPGFTDSVRVDIEATGKTCCTAKTSFLSGERTLDLPPVEAAEANPVILYFLERDIREMARLTARKNGNYFRNRIRRTMVDEAQVRDTTVTWQGKTLPAREVVLTPYATDPARSRFERYATKQYTFLLAPGVPGGVFQIRTSMTGTQAGDPAVMIEEVLSFAGVDAAPAPSAKR